MVRDARELPRDGLRRQHVVHTTGSDGAPRHAVIFRRRRILRERHPALRLDFRHTERTVRAGTRKNDSDRPAALFIRQGTHEVVDGHMQTTRLLARGDLQYPARNGHGGVRRNHIDVVWLQRQTVRHLSHPHHGLFGKQLGQDAVVGRIQVLNQNESHSGGGRQSPDEFGKGFDPARRRADGNNQESVVTRRRSALWTWFGHGSLRLCGGLCFHLILIGKSVKRKRPYSFSTASSVSTTANNWQE